jgi:hypothetical protein
MKAEYRHQLQTNALADHVGRLVQGIKSGPKSTQTAGWIFAVLAVGTAIGWYVLGSVAGNQSEVWTQLGRAQTPQSFQQIADQHPGTLPARTAQFARARLLLQRGLVTLYGSNRTRAIDDLQEVRRLYVSLLPASSDEPLLKQEALLGMARAEEALVGVPKEGETDQLRGSLDQAIRWYRQLADSYPESYAGKLAAQHLEDLQNEEVVQKFYVDLNHFEASPKTPPVPDDFLKK